MKNNFNKKRKNDDSNINSNKKKYIVNWNEMISASSVRNYMLDDPLIDWLKYYSIDNINTLHVISTCALNSMASA